MDLERHGAGLLALVGEDAGPSSPLRRSLDLQAMLVVGAESQRVDEAVTALLGAISTQGALNVALIRYLASTASREPAWRDLDPQARISLLWSYADQLVAHLCPPGADFRDVARWLEGHTNFPAAERLGEAGLPPWYDRLSVELTEARLTGSLVARAARGGVAAGGSSEALGSMMQACGTVGATTWFPDMALVAAVPPAPDGLWAATDPLAADALGAWLHPDHPFARRTDEEMARALLAMASTQDEARVLPVLLANVDARSVAPATASRMRAVFGGGSCTEAFEPNTSAVRRILSAEASLRAREGDEVGMHAVLAREARRCAARWPGRKVVPEDADGSASASVAILVEASIEFALKLDRGTAERFGAFAECVVRFVDAWPECSRAAAARLDAATRLGDAEAGGALWPTLLELRTRP